MTKPFLGLRTDVNLCECRDGYILVIFYKKYPNILISESPHLWLAGHKLNDSGGGGGGGALTKICLAAGVDWWWWLERQVIRRFLSLASF